VSESPAGCSLGVDIGGTFTDIVVLDDGRATFGKVLTTPHDPADALLAGSLDTLARAGVAPSSVRRVAHATTLATNVVLERTGVTMAFVTTKGFRSMLPLGRSSRGGDDRFDLFFEPDEPPVPLERCFEVPERLGPGGVVEEPLDERAAHEVGRRIAALGVDAVAVCLLHSYANPAHEQRLGAILAEHLPATSIVLSCEVWPEIREFDRAATTVLSAYVGPVMAGYLDDLGRRLREVGIDAPIHVADSSGGVMSAELASSRAVRTIESGPAAGVVSATGTGVAAGFTDLLSFDMGGTTAKAAVVRDGRPDLTYDFRVGGSASARGRGSGMLIKVPAVDLVEVGSGGGSVAWVDAAGALHVGPQSAGADPGPACYGQGGTQATVTDADLVLGYLAADEMAGGRVPLDITRAEAALQRAVAAPLGLSLIEAAWAVHELANALMGDAVHIVTVQRGIDPRRFTLVALGGAGPVHAARIAERFDVDRVLVPVGTGVGSAFGLLTSDVVTERSRAVLGLDLPAIEAVLAELEGRCRDDLGGDGHVERAADARYRGQGHDLTVDAPGGPVDKAWLDEVVERFHLRYAERYGTALRGPVELVAARVRLRQPHHSRSGSRIRPQVVGFGTQSARRRAWFGSGWVDAAVFDRGAVPERIVGPAIVHEPEATTVVPPSWVARVDAPGNLVMERDRG